MIPAGFGLSCALLAASVILLFVRGTSGMENIWMFSIGADVFCLAVCVMLSFSCVLNYKNRNDHTRVFVTLLTVNAAARRCFWMKPHGSCRASRRCGSSTGSSMCCSL